MPNVKIPCLRRMLERSSKVQLLWIPNGQRTRDKDPGDKIALEKAPAFVTNDKIALEKAPAFVVFTTNSQQARGYVHHQSRAWSCKIIKDGITACTRSPRISTWLVPLTVTVLIVLPKDPGGKIILEEAPVLVTIGKIVLEEAPAFA